MIVDVDAGHIDIEIIIVKEQNIMSDKRCIIVDKN